MPRIYLAACTLFALVSSVPADDTGAGPQRFRMNPYHANLGRITSVAEGGEVTLADLGNPRFVFGSAAAALPDLSEGTYLAFVGPEFAISTRDARLVRVQVVEILPERTARVKVSESAAERIEKGEQMLLFRPPGSTTKELAAAPDIAEVDDGTPEVTPLGSDARGGPASLLRSKNNLKQLGLAMHNYHDAHGHFPPAVIHGPDGKPWHSWRVLILPFIDETALYEQYRFDEPWNGPNNKKLISRMPDVYRDPVFPPSGENYTNYAVVSGPNTAFPGEGVRMRSKQNAPLGDLTPQSRKLRIRDMIDGTSNSLLAGPVSPERKVPWTKPEDVVFEEQYPRPGEEDSFAAPYESRYGRGAPFLFADGSVRAIRTDVDAQTWQRLLQINDGQVVGEIAGFGRARRSRGRKAVQVIEIREVDGKRKAVLRASR